MCFTLEYSEVPNVDFAEFNNICSTFENAFENNENINLYPHSEKIHKWNQGKCSEFQNQIDLKKIEELKKLLYEVTSMNLNITEASSSVDKLKIILNIFPDSIYVFFQNVGKD
jgi:uncharacterized membrane protein YjjP (DUF1212 family)